jgi:hypothetical protein
LRHEADVVVAGERFGDLRPEERLTGRCPDQIHEGDEDCLERATELVSPLCAAQWVAKSRFGYSKARGSLQWSLRLIGRNDQVGVTNDGAFEDAIIVGIVRPDVQGFIWNYNGSHSD